MPGTHYRHDPEARRRFRRRRVAVGTGFVVIVAGTVVGVVEARSGHAAPTTNVTAGRADGGTTTPGPGARAATAPSPSPSTTSSSTVPPPTTGTSPTSSTTTSTTSRPAAPTGTSSGLFTEPGIASYVASEGGVDLTAAVDDLDTGRVSLYRPGVQEDTASIVKADILATLLDQQGGTLTPAQEALATLMIENSDNDAATSLWDDVGEATGISAFDASAGLTDTAPGQDGYWGLTMTTAADQVHLLRDLVGSTGFAVPNRNYEIGLMEQVEADQDWGISGGVPTGVQVAVKDGWLPLQGSGDWQVNSIGWVDGDGRDYVVAVLTQGSATEGQGIAAIQGLAGRIWAATAR